MPIVYHEKSKEFHLYNKEVSYLFQIIDNGQLGQLYSVLCYRRCRTVRGAVWRTAYRGVPNRLVGCLCIAVSFSLGVISPPDRTRFERTGRNTAPRTH